MKIRRLMRKKRTALFLAATMPFLIGFNSANAEETVDQPFSEEKSSEVSTVNTPEENQPAETPPPAEIVGEMPQVEPRETQTDAMVREYFKKYDGKTIVDISFEGASDKTLPTVKSAIIAHVGDNFE